MLVITTNLTNPESASELSVEVEVKELVVIDCYKIVFFIDLSQSESYSYG